MSILTGARAATPEPLILTICGTPGTGKTSLAATLPGPAFLIQTQGEKTPRDLPPGDMPVSIGETDSPKKLWDQLLALATEEHPYKTVIIDSVTGLETLFADDILKNDPKAKSIQTAMGGYGAGRDAVAVMHNRVRKAAEVLRRKGMHVVFIAHSDIVSINPPDGEGYSQYSLRLHSKSMAAYVDSVDVVGFIKQATVVVGKDGENKRAVSTGERVLVTYLTPTAITKNRIGITEDIPLVRGQNPFAQYMAGEAATPKTTAATAPEANNEEEEVYV
jgi:phage nucleotide-binding protein